MRKVFFIIKNISKRNWVSFYITRPFGVYGEWEVGLIPVGCTLE